MKKLNFFLLTLFTVGFILTSCEKNKDTDVNLDAELEIAEDDALATNMLDDVFNEAEEADTELSLKSASTVICRDVDKEWSGDTLIITITYNGDCEYEIFNRSLTRSGKIIIKRFGGRMFDSGATKIITFEDYYVNNTKLEGTKTIVSEGVNADSTEVMFYVTLVGGQVTFEDGTVVTRDSEKTRLWYVGENHWDRSDDYYLINGTSTGVNYLGETYTRTLTDLLAAPTCSYIKSGTVEIVIGEETPILLDYGDGECDPYATITKDGVTKDITLQLKKRSRRFFR